MVEQMDLFASSYSEETETPKQEEKKGLTFRQKNLYKLIEHNSFVENRKTSQREIVENIAGYSWNDDPHIHDHCSAIWNDINAIKNSEDASIKVILSKDFLYWIGNDKELSEFADDYFDTDIAPRLYRYWNMKNKCNGTIETYDLFLNQVCERFKRCKRK